MREQDPGPGGAIPQGISHDEASQENAASGCTALSQSSQGSFPEETREEDQAALTHTYVMFLTLDSLSLEV